MVLKVTAFDLGKKTKSSTDLAKFLYSDSDKQIQLSFLCSPQILVFPTYQSKGLIRVNKTKKLPIGKDGHFFYGAWPQSKVSPVQSKKLNQMLKDGQIRLAGHYYDLSKRPCQEYELKEKRYVLISDAGVWFEVKPIEWCYDFKTKAVHSVQTIWSSDDLSPQQLASFGWQALQSNKVIMQAQNNQPDGKDQTLREAQSDVLHAVRFLRDQEKKMGIVSGKGQKIYDLLRCRFYQNKQKGRK